MQEKTIVKPTLLQSSLTFLMCFSVIIGGLLFVKGMIGMTVLLMIALFLAAGISMSFGFSWDDIQKFMISGISKGVIAVFILMLVGMLSAVWIMGGTIPAMIFYGLQLISPKLFLTTTLLLCSIVSIATGTSWGTIGTMGIAIMGIGVGMDISPPMIAGAVVAGAFFGDKMSPLSDTTNVAPAMAGTTLFEHIGSMLYTTVPAFVISLVVYLFLGFSDTNELDLAHITRITHTIRTTYDVNVLTLVPPCLIIVLSYRKVPAMLALGIGVLFSIFWALLMQNISFQAVLTSSITGAVSKTGLKEVDTLLSRGGLNSMMAVNVLIIIATAFGGILERTGILSTIIHALTHRMKRTGDLIVFVMVSCYAIVMATGNSIIGIILPGRAFKPTFEQRGIAPRVLSRTLEDATTIGAPLIPWSAAGLYVTAMLGVPTLEYLPYAVLNWMVPIIAIFYGYTGIAIFKADPVTGAQAGADTHTEDSAT